MTSACSHLAEVRKALAAGHWPQAVAPELRSHATTCTRCTQEILITQHLFAAKASALTAFQTDAPHAAPQLLWWRAQLRRRNAALAQAARPIAAAQLFAIAITAAAAIGLIVTHWDSIFSSAAHAPASSFMALLTNWGLAPLLLAITLVATLGGLALYLSADRQ
ncbi:MAG TPA: hypothetical protein VN612_17795 [Acidobacteriaceae bacterium]|nr:hypothetical protein [Acidobacteriaceae bacterium]